MDRLQVVGVIHAETGAVSLEPLFILPDTGEIDPREPGDHAIVLRDADAIELAYYAFTAGEVIQETAPLDPNTPPSTLLFFSELVPYVDGTARVDIEGPTGVLTTVTAGMTPPVVEVLSPNGGENLAPGEVIVAWTADDTDGDSLTFDVEYTTDDGATWTAVAMAITDTSIAIDPMNLVGSTQARFRVWATDGIHTGGDESDAVLTVENLPPSADIVGPAAENAVVVGTTVGFQADVVDDGGSMDDEEVQWRSSLDGTIGSGSSLAVSTLSVGTHTITLRADDGDGGVAEDSVEVLVVAERSQLPTPDDALQVGPPLLSFGPTSGAMTVSIDNVNLQRSIDWVVMSSEPWVVLDMNEGTTPAQVHVSLDPAGQEPGRVRRDPDVHQSGRARTDRGDRHRRGDRGGCVIGVCRRLRRRWFRDRRRVDHRNQHRAR